MSNKSESVKKWRRLNNEWIRKIKEETPCRDCGKSYHFSVMQFDHIRGEKLFNISRCLSTTFGKQRIIEEMDKCEVVCANCHAMRTWNRKNNENVVGPNPTE